MHDHRIKYAVLWVAYLCIQDPSVLFHFIPRNCHVYSSLLAYQEAQWAYGFEETAELGADKPILASGQWPPQYSWGLTALGLLGILGIPPVSLLPTQYAF